MRPGSVVFKLGDGETETGDTGVDEGLPPVPGRETLPVAGIE